MKYLFFVAVIMFSLTGSALAGNYCIFKEMNGRILLTNLVPPPGASIVNCRQWRDATEVEIAATTAENKRTEVMNIERDRTAAIERLAAEIAKITAEPTPAPQPVYINVNTSTIVQPTMRKLHR